MRISDWSSDVCSSDLRHDTRGTLNQNCFLHQVLLRCEEGSVLQVGRGSVSQVARHSGDVTSARRCMECVPVCSFTMARSPVTAPRAACQIGAKRMQAVRTSRPVEQTSDSSHSCESRMQYTA